LGEIALVLGGLSCHERGIIVNPAIAQEVDPVTYPSVVCVSEMTDVGHFWHNCQPPGSWQCQAVWLQSTQTPVACICYSWLAALVVI